jgi:hypothetical protein
MKILNFQQEIKRWAEQVPLISSGEARILYDNDRYNGPLAGVLSWKDKNYYFYSYDGTDEEIKNTGKRAYAVIEMSLEQEQEEEYWQKQLVERVGAVNKYDENNSPIFQAAKSQEEHEKYWKEYQSKLKPYTLTQDQIKARWELGGYYKNGSSGDVQSNQK